MEQQLVIFEMGEEHFGVYIATVEIIIKLQALTKGPSPRTLLKAAPTCAVWACR